MTNTQKASGWKHSMWILWTFTLVLNWVGFLFIGTRAKRPAWFFAGVVYATPVVLLLVLSGNARMIDALAVVLLGLVSVVHAFLVREPYRQLVMAEQEQKLRKYQSLQELIGSDQEVATAHNPRSGGIAEAEIPSAPRLPDLPEDSSEEPLTAEIEPSAPAVVPAAPQRLQTMTQRVDAFVLEDVEDNGRQAVQASSNSSMEVINLNTASAEEIGSLPGIGRLLGMTAVSIRETQGRFKSLEQFVDAIGLKPHVADRIRPFVSL